MPSCKSKSSVWQKKNGKEVGEMVNQLVRKGVEVIEEFT
jgi:hypothetical protein